MSRSAIRAEALSKRYRIGEQTGYSMLRESLVNAAMAPFRRKRGPTPSLQADEHIWALRNVSFEIAPGEVVGVIGRNGAGKTTLLKILSRITQPTEGAADVWGRVGSLLEVGTGFHPELTGRENVRLNGAILGMRRSEVERKFDEIVAFAGVERFIDTPVKRYSSGMQVRLAFAVAAHLEPDILLVDEVLAVGDAEFQQRCIGRMEDVSAAGRTVVFISHSMPAVLRLCPRVILLDRGGVVADGDARDVIRTYLESGLGTSAERRWDDAADAPGDDIVRLRAVRVVDDRGHTSEQIDITRPVAIEVEYRLLRPVTGIGPGVVLLFSNDEGVTLFVSTSITELQPSQKQQEPGVVRTVCTIPANLLAEGEVLIEVLLVSRQPPALHGGERDAVAFHVVDRSGGRGVRGDLGGHWPGVVRPRLTWTSEPAD